MLDTNYKGAKSLISRMMTITIRMQYFEGFAFLVVVQTQVKTGGASKFIQYGTIAIAIKFLNLTLKLKVKNAHGPHANKSKKNTFNVQQKVAFKV